MAIILLRSPIYKTDLADIGSPNSTKCTITIDGASAPDYVLVKSTTSGATMVWEIAELLRDYINITFNGTYTPETLAVVTVITSHASTDGSGTALTTDSDTDVAYDGYGTYMQGSNPTFSRPDYLISGDPQFASLNSEYYIYYPKNLAGVVPLINTAGSLSYASFNTTDTIVTGNASGRTLNIIRIDCSKYLDGHKVTFVNKFGALQDIWFFLKDTLVTNKKNDSYQSNTIVSGVYSVNNHAKKVFNTTSTRQISLSSGFYPEWTNQWFEQLLLSEQIWYSRTVFNGTSSNTTEVVPINISTSSMTHKTVINDKLIQYTFNFDMAFDYINNVR